MATAPPGRTVYEVVLRQAALVEDLQGRRAAKERLRKWREEEEQAELGWGLLGDAYDRCGEVCAEYAKTFYLGESVTTVTWSRFVPTTKHSHVNYQKSRFKNYIFFNQNLVQIESSGLQDIVK